MSYVSSYEIKNNPEVPFISATVPLLPPYDKEYIRGEAADKAVVQSTDDEEEEERGPGVNDYTFEPDPEDVVMTEEEFDNPEAVSPVGNDLDKDLDVTVIS